MSVTAPHFEGSVQSRRRPQHDWVSAIGALRRVLANPEDISQVFAIMRALNGDSHAKGYIKLLATDDGGRIAYDRVELAERLLDESWKATFPSGSVGATYIEFLESEHLSAQGLIDASHRGVPDAELDPRHPYAWFARRIRDIHDIWHALTGYGRDALGELCMVAFSYEQTRGTGWAFVACAGFLHAHGPAGRQARKAILEARRRGRRAAWLPGEDYERLLLEPLAAARHRLGISAGPAYDAVPLADRELAVR